MTHVVRMVDKGLNADRKWIFSGSGEAWMDLSADLLTPFFSVFAFRADGIVTGKGCSRCLQWHYCLVGCRSWGFGKDGHAIPPLTCAADSGGTTSPAAWHFFVTSEPFVFPPKVLKPLLTNISVFYISGHCIVSHLVSLSGGWIKYFESTCGKYFTVNIHKCDKNDFKIKSFQILSLRSSLHISSLEM